MYFEDADLCRRARARGDRVIWSSEAFVIHHAQRASHKDLKHFAWHARSAIRYLTS
jgi:GT2 family glycosyltransferase